MTERGFRMITDPPTLSSSWQLTPDEEVRKMACIRGNSSPQANLGVLKRLIGARHELAQILGDRHYAEFVLKNSMASSSSVVMPLLQEMSKMVRPSADEEFKKIRDFKRKRCVLSLEDLEPCDETFYAAHMKYTTYNLDSLVVASYFPLPQCIEGLKVLVQSLFGATFCCVPLAPDESWHPDVIKLSLHHPEEIKMVKRNKGILSGWVVRINKLSKMNLNLLWVEPEELSVQRLGLGLNPSGKIISHFDSWKGEYPGCAHFSIKGGRRVSETDYQLPVVALVCNFSGSHNPFNVKLNHSQLETLFHEFGHALQSLLARTESQQFSGTRVALDFAETPSNLFEYYAWVYRVLRRCARHYSTGEVIPQKLVESMEDARNMFAATELQRQVTAQGPGLIPKSYYSYLYAKCFAASIWQKVCKEDPLSLSTGEALRTKFLQHGGAREPADLLKGLVGDGVLRHCNGGIVPDLTSLCDEMKLC